MPALRGGEGRLRALRECERGRASDSCFDGIHVAFDSAAVAGLAPAGRSVAGFGVEVTFQGKMCRVRANTTLLGLGLTLLAAVACAGKVSSTTCVEGTERCACYRNAACNSGLECRRDLCVSASSGATGGAAVATGGTTSSGGTTGGAGFGGVPPCPSIVGYSGDCGSQSMLIEDANVLLVVEKSGSMADPLGGTQLSKWLALNSALTTTLAGAPGRVSFGLELFPGANVTDQSADLCAVPDAATAIDVPIGDVSTTAPLIVDALAATQPGGGSPASAALARAYDYFTTGAGKDLTGERYVVLVTDGGPNCNSASQPCASDHCTVNLDGQCGLSGGASCCAVIRTANQCVDDVEVLTQLRNLAGAGVPTFVVGLAGTEPYAAFFDAFAVAGGKPASATSPRYYAVPATGGVSALTSVLESITRAVDRSCTVQLVVDPPAPELLNIAIDCEVVPAVVGAGGAGGATGGWQVDTSTTPVSILFDGSVCDYVRSGGAQRIDVIFGCSLGR